MTYEELETTIDLGVLAIKTQYGADYLANMIANVRYFATFENFSSTAEAYAAMVFNMFIEIASEQLASEES